MSEDRTSKVDKADYTTYSHKADEFYEGMLHNEATGRRPAPVQYTA
ncbi:MAG: hypothetical protein WC408_03965 [Candidatus Micrarchaeia archaeon]|jgi:hypothetical protein